MMRASTLKRRIAQRRREQAGEVVSDFIATRKREAYDRTALFERDRGVCANCGTDMDAVKKRYREADWLDKQILAQDHGIPVSRQNGDWWDGDHTVPVVEGGSSDLSNLRTLCLKCHRAESDKLVARKAKALRVARKFNAEFATRDPHTEEVL